MGIESQKAQSIASPRETSARAIQVPCVTTMIVFVGEAEATRSQTVFLARVVRSERVSPVPMA